MKITIFNDPRKDQESPDPITIELPKPEEPRPAQN